LSQLYSPFKKFANEGAHASHLDSNDPAVFDEILCNP